MDRFFCIFGPIWMRKSGSVGVEQAVGGRLCFRNRCRYRHHRIRPSRSQKCDLQPVRRQTDGERDGQPFPSTLSRQRCSASANRASSIKSPQPHGQVMPALQASPSSCATTTVRMGSRSGRMSVSSHRVRQRGSRRFAAFCHRRLSRVRSLCHQRRPIKATAPEPGCSAAVPGRRGPTA